MTHSFNKIWIHGIWSTKYRQPLLHKGIEQRVYDFIAQQFFEMECHIEIINGMPDHIHCLFLLNRQKSIADVIKQVKGSSSFYINQNKLTPEKFAWQNGYAAFSVSASGLETVFTYIKNQKEHHQQKAFAQELDEYLKQNGLEPGDDQ